MWRLEGDDFVELVGRRQRRWPVSSLLAARFAAPIGGRRAVSLRFPRGRVLVVSHSWAGPGRFEDRSAGFSTLVRALALRAADSAPAARFTTTGVAAQDAFIWAVALLGGGAAALVLFSMTAGAAAMGIAMAARMVFLLILIFAVTPWLRPAAPALNPRDLPHGLLP